jgi:hypothetical protein
MLSFIIPALYMMKKYYQFYESVCNQIFDCFVLQRPFYKISHKDEFILKKDILDNGINCKIEFIQKKHLFNFIYYIKIIPENNLVNLYKDGYKNLSSGCHLVEIMDEKSILCHEFNEMIEIYNLLDRIRTNILLLKDEIVNLKVDKINVHKIYPSLNILLRANVVKLYRLSDRRPYLHFDAVSLESNPFFYL